MIFCCSITCSLRKSTSLSSWLWSRSFKELGLLIVPALCLWKKPTWWKRRWSEGFAKGQYTTLPFSAGQASNLMAVLAAILLPFCWALHLDGKHARCCCKKLVVTGEDSGRCRACHDKDRGSQQLCCTRSLVLPGAYCCSRRNSESWNQCELQSLILIWSHPGAAALMGLQSSCNGTATCYQLLPTNNNRLKKKSHESRFPWDYEVILVQKSPCRWRGWFVFLLRRSSQWPKSLPIKMCKCTHFSSELFVSKDKIKLVM